MFRRDGKVHAKAKKKPALVLNNDTVYDDKAVFAFTVTLPKKYYDHPAEVQYDLTYAPLARLLHQISHRFTCVAELTKNCNLHYHGAICFPIEGPNNRLKLFCDTFRNTIFGFVNIKANADNGWYEYITKCLDSTRQSIGRPPIIYDALEIIKVPTLDGMVQEDLSTDC